MTDRLLGERFAEETAILSVTSYQSVSDAEIQIVEAVKS
jgi:hypothetical protein